ncbi:MAG: RICIN domain-containing protein [Paludibacter sp.]|nr:RICIN domain-containing protein [Paludibacter sp.]
MRKNILIIICLLSLTVTGQNYLKNGGFEYGLNTGWDYVVSSGSTASFTLDNGSKVMEGKVALKVNVTSLSASNINSVKASAVMQAGNDSLYLLRFWARGPEEAEVYVEANGSNTQGVTYQMHTGKTLFYFPFKFDPKKANKEIKINFYFRDDVTAQKTYTTSICSVNSYSGATYYLDGVEVLDPNNKQNIDVINTYTWNNNLPTNVSGWVAGDNDVSILLPDGRKMWFFNDSFYAKSNQAINRLNDIGKFIRNAVAVQDINGKITTRPVTDQSGQTVYFRIPADQLILNGSNATNFFWVGDAIMENNKVKVHLIECQEANGTVINTMRSYLASFSYPDLVYLGVERQSDFCATFETFFVDDADNRIYLYRSENQSYTHVARTTLGNLNGKNGNWEYWNGTTWTTNKTEGDAPAGRVNNMMADGVMKLGPGNYAQVSMPVMSHDVQVSFAPAPQGPWTAKQTIYTASQDSASWYYMPNFHGILPNGNYSISFSANFTYCLFFCQNCQTWAFVDKYWYRPRYIQVDLQALSPYSVKKDCAGVENGAAYIDACEECVGGTTGKNACVTGIAKLYSESNFSGNVIGLNVGNYSATDLQALGFSDNDLSSMELTDGYIAELFDNNNYIGNPNLISSTTASLETISFDNKTTSVVIRRMGMTDLTGIYAIQNKQSGLYMTIQNQSKENNALVVQSGYTDSESQHFELDYIGHGYYNIINAASKLPISPVNLSKEPQAKVEQWNGLNYSDITDFAGGSVSAQYEAAQAVESIGNLIDNNTTTKYRTLHGRAWVQFHSANPQIVTRYSLVAANNAPISDPKNWSLWGSSDGVNWVLLDTIAGAKFQSRFEERFFNLNNQTPYTFYRLNMECYSGSALHLAEWKLFIGVISDQGVDNQKFIVQDAGNGYVKLINKRSDMALEVLDGFNQAGANVWQIPDIGQEGILWKLVAPQSLGLEELTHNQENSNLIIYPNPVRHTLNLKLSTDWLGSDFSICNINGSLVYSGNINTMSVDIRRLQSGYYLIKIVRNDNVLISRFIKN